MAVRMSGGLLRAVRLLALLGLLLVLPIVSARRSTLVPSSRQQHGAASAAQPSLANDQYTNTFSTLSRDKWIGLGLAISSSLAIGTSFIITKKGLMDAAERGSGMASDGHAYLQNPIWWAGMSTMIVGEVANFAAYTFAPPILVTPLGALSVLIGAILASFILKEELGRLGRVGCTLCLVGTVIIIMNAPEDKEIQTVDEMLNYAIQLPFLTYCLFVTGFAIFMIFKIVPKYGKRTPVVYISICSLVGSISVMSVKGFGVALKLTLDGNNQFSHPSTYCFALVVVVCILVQMNYFNKALDQFSTNIVNPIYYVMFTTSTIFASFLLFRGFNTEGAGPAISLIGGFVVIFLGVYLLNLNRLIDPITQQSRVSFVTGEGLAGTGRLSEHHERLFGEGYHMRTGSGVGRNSLSYPPPRRTATPNRRDSTNSSVLFGYDENEETVGLTRLNEDGEENYDDDAATAAQFNADKYRQQKAAATAAKASRFGDHAGGGYSDVPNGRARHTPSSTNGQSVALHIPSMDSDPTPDNGASAYQRR
jgi:drug/metabolite transporter (DMT)-like permease